MILTLISSPNALLVLVFSVVIEIPLQARVPTMFAVQIPATDEYVPDDDSNLTVYPVMVLLLSEGAVKAMLISVPLEASVTVGAAGASGTLEVVIVYDMLGSGPLPNWLTAMT
jgi:hypothetical protein